MRTGAAQRRNQGPRSPSAQPCIKLIDGSVRSCSADWLSAARDSRDPSPLHARLSQQFIAQNAAAFRALDMHVSTTYDGAAVSLVFQSGTRVGAVPLISPITGRQSLGLVVQPRYGWDGIGPVMGYSGWRVVPNILRLPMLPRSARDIPPWVLSAIVLVRLRDLLESIQRRFEYTTCDMPAPRGTVDWARYATARAAVGRFDRVPCRFPDLRDDSSLLSAVHYALRAQLQSLETQRGQTVAVMRLLDLCHDLLRRVGHAPAIRPSPSSVQRWMRTPLRSGAFADGVEAIEWTADERGLAGMTDLRGLPWAMAMEEFFESWVEAIAHCVAARIGGSVRAGRKNETVAPISWDPPFRGSQRSLRPDVILDGAGHTVIFDAKYKPHGEELDATPWWMTDEQLRESHRNDLLQVLAYANLSETDRTTVILAYPCRRQQWDAQVHVGRAHHRAELHAAQRRVSVLLVTVPLAAECIDDAANYLARLITN